MTISEHIISQKLKDRRGLWPGHNQVFEFSYQGKRYFAKLYKEKEGFQRETLALENFGAADIPVPKIVFTSTSYGGAENCLLITERIKGTTLDNIERRRNSYCYQAGRLLAKIHALKIPALVQPLVIPVEEIAQQIIAFAANEKIQHPLLRSLETTLEELNLSPDTVLSHGDYISRHIFVFRGTVSGIVDWEGIRAARPELDLGHCSAFLEIFGDPTDVHSFIKGYGANFDEAINNKLKLYYKIIFARYWKRLNKEQEYKRAICSINTQPN
jgi:aminoglycoside phosphotransferase (APT) family kinase protein